MNISISLLLILLVFCCFSLFSIFLTKRIPKKSIRFLNHYHLDIIIGRISSLNMPKITKIHFMKHLGIYTFKHK